MRMSIAAVLAAALFSSPASTQQRQITEAVPDFSGIWGHPYLFPGFEQPFSGHGPLVNKYQRKQLYDADGRSLPTTETVLVGDNNKMAADYSDPILKPPAAEAVKKHGAIELGGEAAPNPSNQCWPEPVPYIFWNFGVQILQQQDKVTILYDQDHEFRQVRMNQPHPAQVTPSWYGDSIGYYEGDTRRAGRCQKGPRTSPNSVAPYLRSSADFGNIWEAEPRYREYLLTELLFICPEQRSHQLLIRLIHASRTEFENARTLCGSMTSAEMRQVTSIA